VKTHLRQLFGHRVHATDGKIGRIRDVLFDDRTWTIRYLAIELGVWLIGRQVLVPPRVIRRLLSAERAVEVSLTREQIRGSLDALSAPPLSRQEELRLLSEREGVPHWAGYGVWALGMVPFAPNPAALEPAAGRTREHAGPDGQVSAGDPHLRSVREVATYRVVDIGWELGRVDDLLFDDESSSITALIVRERQRGGLVVPATAVDHVSFPERTVFVKLGAAAPAT